MLVEIIIVCVMVLWALIGATLTFDQKYVWFHTSPMWVRIVLSGPLIWLIALIVYFKLK